MQKIAVSDLKLSREGYFTQRVTDTDTWFCGVFWMVGWVLFVGGQGQSVVLLF